MAHEPPRQTAADFHPEVLRLFDRYVHGLLDRRGFIEGAARFSAGGVSGAALLAALSPRFAQAQQVPPGDARIRGEKVKFPSPRGYGQGGGYLVRPAAANGSLPAVLVVHENRGLNPHIEDIARRLALENFVVFAPDALDPLGGYPGDEDKARELFSKLDQSKTQEDFIAAASYLKNVSNTNGKMGVVGFCYGGGIANFLATKLPELGAAVPFYGMAPPADQVPNIKAALLLIYADNDERINASWPGYEAALKAANVPFQAVKYPGTQHGFNNDTTPRYDQAAAQQAWARTVALFNGVLRG